MRIRQKTSTARTAAGLWLLAIAIALTLATASAGNALPRSAASQLAAPFPGPAPVAVPGVIEAENYDTGGNGVGYGDATEGNRYHQYRSDNVDIIGTRNDPGNYTVAHTSNGEWLNYTVNITEAGTYTLSPRIGSNSTQPGGMRFMLNPTTDNEHLGDINITNTGGWWTWANPELTNVTLPAGQHTIRIVIIDGGRYLFDNITISQQAPEPSSVTVEIDLGANSTDARQKIQAGLQSLGDDGGTLMVSGSGTYNWNRTLTVSSHQRLVFVDSPTFVATAAQTMVSIVKGEEARTTAVVVERGTWDANAKPIQHVFDVQGAFDGVVIRNATFKNTNSVNLAHAGRAINVNGLPGQSESLQIEGNTFSDYYQMVKIRDTTRIAVLDNKFWNILDNKPHNLTKPGVVHGKAVRYFETAQAVSGGSFIYLLGSVSDLEIAGNYNPGNGQWAYRETEVGGHLINFRPVEKHTHVSIRNNTFIGKPGVAWHRYGGDAASLGIVANGGTGDVLTVRNVEFFEVTNNTVSNSGEFSITVVRGSSNGVVAENEVFGSDGGAIIIGAVTAASDVNKRVSDIEVRDNVMRDIGLDNAKDLQPNNTPRDVASLQANYPNTRSAIRIVNAENVNLIDNDITYNSSGLWLKVNGFSDMRNIVQQVYMSGNDFTATPNVYRGMSKLYDANNQFVRSVDGQNAYVHQVVPFSGQHFNADLFAGSANDIMTDLQTKLDQRKTPDLAWLNG